MDVAHIDAVGIITAQSGIECIKAGAVNIAHNGNTKLNTRTDGVKITGGTDISMNSNGTGQLYMTGNGYTGGIALDATAMNIYHNSGSRDIIFGTNEDEKLRITSAGKVGIATGTPRAKFDVRPGGHSGDGAITFTTGLGEVGSSNNAIQSINGTGSALQPLGYRATEHIFATQSAERLRIKSDGGLRLQKSDGNGNFTISRNASVTSTDQPIGVVDFASNTAHTVQARIMGKTLGTSNVGGDLVVETRADGGSLDERFRITGAGRVGIGSAIPAEKLDVAGHLKLATVQGTNTNANLPVLYQHNDNVIHGGSTLNWNPAEDTLKVNGNLLSATSLYGAGGTLKLAAANHSSTSYVEVTDKVEIAGQIVASQDYPNFRPTIDFNFAAVKKLDPRFTYMRTGPASYIDHLGFVRLSGYNEPRFDHDPDTGECLGLLFEQNATNLIPNSFDGGTWNASSGSTLTRNAGIAPDGTMTATKTLISSNDIDVSTGLGPASAGATAQIAISGGTTYTLSIWAKASTTAQIGNNFKIRWKRVQGDNVFSSTTFALTENWTRHSTTATTAANNSTVACMVGGVSGSEALVWGAQLEATDGGGETSLIPTYGESRTRSNETLSIEGKEFSDFYNQAEGTLILSAIYNENARSSAIVTIDDTSNTSEYTELGYRAGGASANNVAAYIRTDSGNDQYYKNWTSSATEGNEFKIGLAYKNNDYASSANGSAAHTDSSGTTSRLYDRLRFSQVDTVSRTGSGHYRRLMYYSKRLPNSQLTTLTA